MRERIAVATERGIGTVEDRGGKEVVDVETVVPVSEGACCGLALVRPGVCLETESNNGRDLNEPL